MLDENLRNIIALRLGHKEPDKVLTLLKDFCAKYHIAEMGLFGSILREDFNAQSDIDLIVTYSEQSSHTLFDVVRMKDELEEIFGREVDIVNRKAVEMSKNHYRRDSILSDIMVIYAA